MRRKRRAIAICVPSVFDVAGRLDELCDGNGASMLNRLTVLLKAVIAIISVCVVIALSLTAYASGIG
ncbi:hypothetical protein [Bradyrhizobium sp. 139]|uniref:hypothetical protein n=1 Tax=Bradyrhizobium sp. 139 TaxID=2782616 RepID=UPI001FFB2A69|nr:hypothetical protein [Bradyrhizobium sp. 139]